MNQKQLGGFDRYKMDCQVKIPFRKNPYPKPENQYRNSVLILNHSHQKYANTPCECSLKETHYLFQ
ncbi:MAG: hypothetical protein RLZZ42_977 [Bacteroidota bacterium]